MGLVASSMVMKQPYCWYQYTSTDDSSEQQLLASIYDEGLINYSDASTLSRELERVGIQASINFCIFFYSLSIYSSMHTYLQMLIHKCVYY